MKHLCFVVGSCDDQLLGSVERSGKKKHISRVNFEFIRPSFLQRYIYMGDTLWFCGVL